MAAYLLTWNPKHYEWENFADCLEEVRATGSVELDWSCRNGKVKVGDRVFLMRQGIDPRGVFGAGTCIAEPFDAWGWRDKQQQFIRARFDTLLNPASEPIVKREYLIKKYPPRLAWDTQQSGIQIRSHVAVRLRRDWELVADPPTVAEEVPDDPGLWEGATRQIRVNTYERSPEARRKCLDIHGYECAACLRPLTDTYGPLAERLIDVHHVRPLSSIGVEYCIDPEHDLRPVCPNCHAVMHRCAEDGVPLTIGQVQQLLADNAGP